MRIAVDATAILGRYSRNRGIGKYFTEQLRTMMNMDKRNQYVFLNLQDPQFKITDLINEGIKAEEVSFSTGDDCFLLQKEYKNLHGAVIKKFLKEKDIDVFYVTNPFDESGILYQKEWFEDSHAVAFVYEIAPYMMKERYVYQEDDRNRYMERVEMLRWMDKIQVVSQSVKDDLVSFLDFKPEKIDVIGDGAAEACIESLERLPIKALGEDSNLKRWAVFTPLSPIESGISDYSNDIINELANYADIDVFIDDGYEADCVLKANVKVYNYREFEKKSGVYSQIIYQMGNSPYHIYMYPYIKEYPGTVVLHDYNMHGVVAHISLDGSERQYETYKRYLLSDYGQKAVDDYVRGLERGTARPNIYGIELNGFVTNYAKKIIVHSFEAKRKMLRKNFDIPCCQIWSYAVVGDARKDNGRLKEAKGYSSESIILACFGHVHETKRIIPILYALAEISEIYPNLQLLLVGKMAGTLEKEFDETVASLKLESKVKVTGYIGLEEFKEYIDLADICLNLRYPYNGETSGSLMRIFAKGKCVLVNDIGSFSEFPDKACCKLPSVEAMSAEEEINRIEEAILGLALNKEKMEEIGNEAFAFAKENLDIAKVGKAYVEFLEMDYSWRLKEKDIKKIVSIVKESMKEKDVEAVMEKILPILQYSL